MKTDTGLVVNTNTDEYTRYMMQRKNFDKINTLETEIQVIKEDMVEIKDLLKLLINKHQG